MSSKVNKSTSTSRASSSKSGGSSAAVVQKRGPWAKKCIKWLAEKKPASTVHPLDNPKLLSRIVNSAEKNYDDLRNWRQVNRIFSQVTLEPWRSTATLVILPDITRPIDPCTSKSITDYIVPPVTNKKCGANMSELLLKALDPTDPYKFFTLPFRRIKLRGMHMEEEMEYLAVTSNPFDFINVLPRLLDLIGPHVLYLHFEYCKFENTMKYCSFHKLILEKILNMEKLVISNCIFREKASPYNPNVIIKYDYNMNITKLKVSGEFPMPLACLMTFIPNLRKLKVRQGNRDLHHNKHYFSNIIIPFANMRKFHRNWCNLTNLDAMYTDTFRMGFSPTNHFRTAKLPLAHVSVEIPPFLDHDPKGPNNRGSDGSYRITSSQDLIAPLLREHKETLKVFKIFRAPFSGTMPQFPFKIDCEHLEELKIWGNVVENLNFLENFRNLKVFYLNTLCFDKWDEMKDSLQQEFPYEYQPYQGDIVIPTGVFHRNFKVKMKFMTELTLELTLGCHSITKLSEWMPNLKTFRSILNKKTFQWTCVKFPKLDELGVLYGSKVDNDTITGISPGAIYKDNIRSFENLKRFKMDSFCGKSNLKDSAVYLGFIQLKALQSIQICVSEEMTQKAENDLKRYVPGPVNFIRNYGPGVHENYDCCRRNKFVIEVMSRIPRPTAAEFAAAERAAADRAAAECAAANGCCGGGANCPGSSPARCPINVQVSSSGAVNFSRSLSGPGSIQGPSGGFSNFSGQSGGLGNFPGTSIGYPNVQRSSSGPSVIPGSSNGLSNGLGSSRSTDVPRTSRSLRNLTGSPRNGISRTFFRHK